MKETLASEIIVEQQKEIIDITELFKQLLTVVPYDKLVEMETLCKREASIGHSVILFIKEERERRKTNTV